MPATTVEEGCVVTGAGHIYRPNLGRGKLCGQVAIAGTRPVAFLAPIKSKMVEKFGPIMDFKDLDLKPKPTLGDVAKKLRPAAKRMKVGSDIFKGEPTSMAGEDGVEWWGWKVENKRPGVEKKEKWVFVAVQKVEK